MIIVTYTVHESYILRKREAFFSIIMKIMESTKIVWNSSAMKGKFSESRLNHRASALTVLSNKENMKIPMMK